MRRTILAAAAIIVTGFAQDDCQTTYNQCISSGAPEVKCSCDLTACLGEDAARIREWCASATANLTTSTSSTPTSTSSRLIITGTLGSQPSGQPTITAAEGSLGLGETCSDSRQCANGVDCWGSTGWTIRACGNFNAACSNSSQCAYNTCNKGLCNGFLPSSAWPAAAQSTLSTSTIYSNSTSIAVSTTANATLSMKPTGCEGYSVL